MRLTDIAQLDDDALGAALMTSVEQLPEADPARLASIRDRLPLTTKATQATTASRWLQLVLLAVLGGSGLALAWWGIDQLFQSQPAATAVPAMPTVTEQQAAPNHRQTPLPKQDQQTHDGQQQDERRGPIIFQQERY